MAILKARRARSADKARKELHAIFNNIGFKITAEVNHHVVNFLDLTLDLKNETFHLLGNQTTTHSTSTVDLTTHLLSSTISLPQSTNASPRFLLIKHPLIMLHHFTKMHLSAATTMYLCNTRPVIIPPVCHLPTEDVVEASFGLIHLSAKQFELTSVEISYS